MVVKFTLEQIRQNLPSSKFAVLQYLIRICSHIFIGNMFDNNMKYFDQVTFTTNVMRKKVCVDISLFSVFSYHACAIASEVINIGQIKHHLSIPQPQIMLPTKCQVIWCISKDIIGIGPI